MNKSTNNNLNSTSNYKQRITIFCQAPADVIYVLDLYEKHRELATISIYCVNVEAIYIYLKTLNLTLESLQFIPYDFGFSLKRPLGFIKIRKRLKTIYSKLFDQKTDETIYFFAIWFDWVTFFFLKELQKNNKIIYYKHYLSVNEIRKEKNSWKEKYIIFQYYLVTRIKLQLTDVGDRSRILFPYKKYNIEQKNALIPETNILKKYLYKIEDVKNKSVLLIESNLENFHLIKDYTQTLISILELLKKKGYNIYVKGHPRVGHSKAIEGVIEGILPKEIPAELLDVTSFNSVLGILSSSISSSTNEKNNIYSLINLFTFYDKKVKNEYINYLRKNSEDNIRFIHNITEICT